MNWGINTVLHACRWSTCNGLILVHVWWPSCLPFSIFSSLSTSRSQSPGWISHWKVPAKSIWYEWYQPGYKHDRNLKYNPLWQPHSWTILHFHCPPIERLAQDMVCYPASPRPRWWQWQNNTPLSPFKVVIKAKVYQGNKLWSLDIGMLLVRDETSLNQWAKRIAHKDPPCCTLHTSRFQPTCRNTRQGRGGSTHLRHEIHPHLHQLYHLNKNNRENKLFEEKCNTWGLGHDIGQPGTWPGQEALNENSLDVCQFLHRSIYSPANSKYQTHQRPT